MNPSTVKCKDCQREIEPISPPEKPTLKTRSGFNEAGVYGTELWQVKYDPKEPFYQFKMMGHVCSTCREKYRIRWI
jgi:hypothetical protein